MFLLGFARLLNEPTIQGGAFSFLTGRSEAIGRFGDRDVAIRLQLKRSRYGQGSLVVAVLTASQRSLNYDGIEARTRAETGRRALFSIAAHDLLLSVEDGWLQALWRPQGLIIFPGRFADDKWREVLEALHVVAASLDAAT